MSKNTLNDLTDVVNDQIHVLKNTVYELCFLELDESVSIDCMRYIVRDLNNFLVKLNVVPVQSDTIDEYGRDKS